MPDPIPILYVDGDSALLDRGKRYLEQNAFFQVDTEVSVQRALTRLRTSQYDAIIAGCQLPDMEGIEFLKEVRCSGITIPFILCIGQGREGVAIQACEDAADVYLHKGEEPYFQFAELMHTVHQAAMHHRSEEAMRLKIDELSTALAASDQRLRQLIATEERFFTLYLNMDAGCFYQRSDGSLAGCNPATLDILGLTEEEFCSRMIGDTAWQVIRRDGSPFPCSEFPSVIALQTEKPVHDVIAGIYNPVRDQYVWVTIDAIPLPGLDTGTTDLVFVSLHDITPRVLAEKQAATYGRILEESLNEIYLFDAGTLRFLEVNPAARRNLGYSLDELREMTPLDIKPRLTRSEFELLLSPLLSGEKKKIRFVTEHLRKDLTRYPAEIHLQLMQEHDHQVFLAVVLDITESLAAKERLQKANQYHRGLIEASPDPFVTISPQGRITDVNRATEHVTGYPRDVLIGTEFSAYFTEPEKAQEGYQSVLEKGLVTDYPLSIQHKSGTVTPVLYNASVYLTQEGSIEGVFAVARDVTRIRETEQSLQSYKAILDATLDAIPDIIGIQDQDHHIIKYNQAGYRFFGLPPEQVDGKRCYELLNRSRLCDECGVAAALETKEFFEGERYLKDRGIYLQCRSNPVLDERGDVTFVVEQLIDITERKRTEDAIREANQKLRLLTGLTRHDILNQLNSINLALELALSEEDIEIMRPLIARAQEAGERIERIIGFTREYEGFGASSSGWYNVAAIIASSRMEVSTGPVIIESLVPAGLEIYADLIIRKVFTTLIENAIRHGKSLTRITFAVTADGSDIMLSCSDDGIGIPADEKEKIFLHGYGHHTGIGLFLAREILAITGLSIREQGTSGMGSRFEILIPMGRNRGMV